jgi:ketosteroid isomerase-like protein
MSEENRQIVQGVYDAWQRGDFEVALEPFHEDIEWFGPPDVSRAGGGEVTRGHEGVRRSVGRWMGAWTDHRFELRELIDSGDQVLAVGWQQGRGRGSGVEGLRGNLQRLDASSRQDRPSAHVSGQGAGA